MDVPGFKKYLRLSVPFVLALISQLGFAMDNPWLLGIGLGGVNRSLQTSTKIANGSPVLAPYNQDIFFIQKPSSNAMIAVFGGYQWSSSTPFLPYYSLSLGYEHQFSANIRGTVEQYALPQFINYHYSMKLHSSIIDLVGKINLIEFKAFLPYLSAGLGAAFNRVRNYEEQAIPPVNPARISPGYTSKTNNHFAYTLGAGIDYIYYENLWLTLGYEYLHLGNVQSGQGQESWSNTNLNFGSLKTNTIFGRVTFFF